MENRLLEICEKVLEINKTAKEYVAIFADGGWDNYNMKDRLYFIFKDGNGNQELMNLEYEDYLLVRQNDLIKPDCYGGFKARSIFEFKIDAVENKLKELRGKSDE